MQTACEIQTPPRARAATASPRLGIIGGGQLARMTALAARPLGVEVVLLEKDPHSPAARLLPDCVVGDWTDRDTLRKFADRCDVITLENEFVDAAALEFLERAGHEVFPGAACMAVTQDKFTQKSVLQQLGLPRCKPRPRWSPPRGPLRGR
jgi:5-(carboxyamino)imidazole ribonucleotide synthase